MLQEQNRATELLARNKEILVPWLPGDLIKEEILKLSKAIISKIAIGRRSGKKRVVFLCNLNGGNFLLHKILENIYANTPLQNEFNRVETEFYFVKTTAFIGKRRRKKTEIAIFPKISLFNAQVFIIDDIIDTGESNHLLQNRCSELGNNKAISVCLLLRTTERNQVYLPGKTQPQKIMCAFPTDSPHFFVGCGMDYHGYYRDMPEIRILLKT